jgi:hypothetical protein
MSVNKNGSNLLNPIATLQTGKANVTEIFSMTGTTRFWLGTSMRGNGIFNLITSTGSVTLFIYNTDGTLNQEFSVGTTTSTLTFNEQWSRIEATPSQTLEMSMTKIPAKITAAGGVTALDTITGTGNYAVGTGTATGGTAGYVAGQKAYVIVAAGSGGGGGGAFCNGQTRGGGNGGRGGVSYNTTPISLSGNYSITVGTAGNGGAGSPYSTAGDGNAGGATNAFTYTSNGGNGGQGDKSSCGPSSGGAAGNAGTPSDWDNTNDSGIFKPQTASKIGVSAGFGAGQGSQSGLTQGGNASAGKVLVLRYTD